MRPRLLFDTPKKHRWVLGGGGGVIPVVGLNMAGLSELLLLLLLSSKQVRLFQHPAVFEVSSASTGGQQVVNETSSRSAV